jgi:crotonobetainyl-CoA:carnitine CoA-transferase CaiB-like acyl-CoA transferase
MSQPLSGIKVLDLTRLLPGPLCSLTLADLGATVVKVEDPDGGDYLRQLIPDLFSALNRNKYSITLNLKDADDRDSFLALVKSYDVVMESFRPGVTKKLSIDYESLASVNPDIVYCSITGYGQSGPYSTHPGHDINYIGYAGILDQVGAVDGPPTLSNFQIADIAGGAQSASIAILSALLAVKSGGKGCYIDISMLDCSAALATMALADSRTMQDADKLRGNGVLSGGYPFYQIYRTKDGKYMALGALEERFRRDFLKKIGRSISSSEELTELFASRTRNEWEEIFSDGESCCTPVLSVRETIQNEQIKARDLLVHNDDQVQWGCPMKLSGFEFAVRNSAPELGQDNAEILGPTRLPV